MEVLVALAIMLGVVILGLVVLVNFLCNQVERLELRNDELEEEVKRLKNALETWSDC